jgi:predicted DNA-binding WGR domain protein
LNLSSRFDSNDSLDRKSEVLETWGMEPGDTPLLLKRADPGRNIDRFYHLAVEPTLFCGFAVRRTWGRVGTWGRTRLDLFADVSSAVAHQQGLAKQKQRRGYRPD